MPACRRTCCSCSTRPMRNMSAATTTRPASNSSRRAENVVMTRTFSKIYGLAQAAHRLDGRRRRMSSTRSTASAGRSTSTARPSRRASPRSPDDGAHRRRPSRTTTLAALADAARSRRSGLDGDAERRQFPARSISRRRPAGRAADADAFLTARGLVLRRRRGLRPARRAAHDRRRRGGEPARRSRRSPISWTAAAPCLSGSALPARAALRALAIVGIGLIGSSIARAARHINLAGRIVAIEPGRGGAGAGARARPRRRGDDATRRRASRGRRSRHPLRAGRRLRRRGGGDAPARSKPGAIVSDVGSVKGSVVAQVAPHLPKGVHFVPAHPVAGTEQSGPDAGFASCSTTAGAS